MKLTFENAEKPNKNLDPLPNSFGGSDLGRTGVSAIGLKGKREDIHIGDPIQLETDQLSVKGVITGVHFEPRTSPTQDGSWATIISFKKREIGRKDLPDVDDFAGATGTLSVLRSLAGSVKLGDAEKRETYVIEEEGEKLPEDDIDISRELEQ